MHENFRHCWAICWFNIKKRRYQVLDFCKDTKKLQLLVVYSCNVVIKVYQKVGKCEYFIIVISLTFMQR